jgi:UDP-N-acetylglucosamine 1-carboxyvinyltransferase
MLYEGGSWKGAVEKHRKQSIRVVGGRPVAGTIENVGGDKTTASKPFFAACISDSPSVVRNVPHIGELEVVSAMLDSVGVNISHSPDGRTVTIDPKDMRFRPIPEGLGGPSRTSMLMAGAQLNRFREANIPQPGGDKIGDRPVDGQIGGLMALGAEVVEHGSGRLVFVAPQGLRGDIIYTFPKPTHTGIENLTIASSKAPGESVFHNTSLAPEVDHGVIHALNTAGANISRIQDLDGNRTREIQVTGVDSIRGLDYELHPDPCAIVTYATAALITESEEGVLIKGIKREPIDPFVTLVERMGGGVDVREDGIRFFYKEPLVAPRQTLLTADTPIDNDRYLGIKSDWQPIISALLLKATGKSRIIEAYFSDRFQHLSLAQQAGADIRFFDPRHDDPAIQYNFTDDDGLHGVEINGGKTLRPIGEMNAGNDIRLGAFELLLSFMTPGSNIIRDLSQIKRGYDHLIENFEHLEAEITHV